MEAVSEYNSSNIPLSRFLKGCDLALSMIKKNSEINLMKLIRAKITGEADDAILGEEFKTVEELKKSLKKYMHRPALY